jgi:hypothetical protein
MEDAKGTEAMTNTDKLEPVDRRQLEVQGEALEAVEKTYGIWQSLKLNKAALVYSTQDPSSTLTSAYNNLVLAAYLCAATYVSDSLMTRCSSTDISRRATTQSQMARPWPFHPLNYISAVIILSGKFYICHQYGLPYGVR